MCQKIFIGIDQTGSARASGKKAAPLCAAILTFEDTKASIRCATLESLSPCEIVNAIGKKSLAECFILVDAVLWPIGRCGEQGLWQRFREANGFHLDGRHYGMQVGKNFFDNLLREIGSEDRSFKSHRACERLVGANSVFTNRPYQRNIQTGTFRIWKDLGARSQWLNVWPFTREPDPARGWLAEGYPSLYWKQILKLSHRRSENLHKALALLLPSLESDRKRDDLLCSNPNFADAAVLAVAAYCIYQKEKLSIPQMMSEEILQSEGWIYGQKKDYLEHQFALLKG